MPQDLGYKSLKLKTDNIRARTRDDLTAVVWRDKRDVHILTNIHNLPVEGIFCNEHGNSIKPYIVEQYNRHTARGLCGHRGQNGKQFFNHLTHMEWNGMELFFHLLDLMALNIYILFLPFRTKRFLIEIFLSV
jgi:hypothetical protein